MFLTCPNLTAVAAASEGRLWRAARARHQRLRRARRAAATAYSPGAKCWRQRRWCPPRRARLALWKGGRHGRPARGKADASKELCPASEATRARCRGCYRPFDLRGQPALCTPRAPLRHVAGAVTCTFACACTYTCTCVGGVALVPLGRPPRRRPALRRSGAPGVGRHAQTGDVGLTKQPALHPLAGTGVAWPPLVGASRSL